MPSLPEIVSLVKRRLAVLSIPKASPFELFLNIESALGFFQTFRRRNALALRFTDFCSSFSASLRPKAWI